MSGRIQSLNNWTPKRAHTFAMRRIEKIRHLLIEIGAAYGDVDEMDVQEADQLLHGAIVDLEEALDDALAEGRKL